MSYTSMYLPKALQEGDEITIAGNLAENAGQFFANFSATVEETDPSEIIYQFKVASNKIYQSWKKSGDWIAHGDTDVETFILGDKNFILTFKFTNNEVLVYSGDAGRNFECRFRLNEPIANITVVHISGDVQRIREVTFRYA